MKRFAVVLCTLFTATCSTSLLDNAPHRSLRGQPGEVLDLYDRFASFTRAWHWHKSEKDFWSFVSRDGPLDRNRDSHVFFDAFTKPVDKVYPGNRDMSSGPFLHELEQIRNTTYEVLNPGHRSFVIARLDLHTLSTKPGFHVHDEQEEQFFSELPSSDYLLAGYGIQGEGYAPRLVVVLWIQEDGRWMVWNVGQFQMKPEEEASASSSFYTYPRFWGLIVFEWWDNDGKSMEGVLNSPLLRREYARTQRRNRYRRARYRYTQRIISVVHPLRWPMGGRQTSHLRLRS